MKEILKIWREDQSGDETVTEKRKGKRERTEKEGSEQTTKGVKWFQGQRSLRSFSHGDGINYQAPYNAHEFLGGATLYFSSFTCHYECSSWPQISNPDFTRNAEQVFLIYLGPR